MATYTTKGALHKGVTGTWIILYGDPKMTIEDEREYWLKRRALYQNQVDKIDAALAKLDAKKRVNAAD